LANNPELAHKIADPLPEFKPQVEQAKVEQQYGAAKAIEVTAAQRAVTQAQKDAGIAEARAKDAETARDATITDLARAKTAADDAQTLATANPDVNVVTAKDAAEAERVKAEAAAKEATTQAGTARTAADAAKRKAQEAQKAATDATTASTPADAHAKRLEAEKAANEVATIYGKAANDTAKLAEDQVKVSGPAATNAEDAYKAAYLIATPSGGGTGGGSTYTYTLLNDTELKQVAKSIYDADHHQVIHDKAVALDAVRTSPAATIQPDVVALKNYIGTDSKLGDGEIQCHNPHNLSNKGGDNGDYCDLSGELIKKDGTLDVRVFEALIDIILEPNPALNSSTNPLSGKPIDDMKKYWCKAVNFAKDHTTAITPKEYLKEALGQFCDPTSIDPTSTSSYTSTYSEAASVLCPAGGFNFTPYDPITC